MTAAPCFQGLAWPKVGAMFKVHGPRLSLTATAISLNAKSGPKRQYSDGNRIVVLLRSASVMIQIFSPLLSV
jgi:hypothetical protein